MKPVTLAWGLIKDRLLPAKLCVPQHLAYLSASMSSGATLCMCVCARARARVCVCVCVCACVMETH